MNALDSPLEALALNYLTYGFLTAVNNIWAWVAVITAAVSFWRIRTLSSPTVSTAELSSRSQEAGSTSSPPPKVPETDRAAAELATVSTLSETQILSAPTKASCRTLEREGETKTKFSLYYKEDDFREDDDGGESEDSGGEAAPVLSQRLGRWCDDWERMMVVRMGDMGWYRWQDTTVLDGSVVRLWGGRRRRRHAAALVVDCGVAW